MTDKLIKVILAAAGGAAVAEEFEKGASGAEHATDSITEHSGRLEGIMSSPWVAAGATIVAVTAGIATAALNAAEGYDIATDKMAATSGMSSAAAKATGDAFLQTAFQSTFSAQQMMDAYGPVSGQLASIEGHALSAADATKVMAAASDLAEASGTDLATSTASLSDVMQAFHIKVGDASATTDKLYNTSRALNVPVGDLVGTMEKLHSKLGPTGGSLENINTLLLDMAKHGLTGKAALTAVSGATDSLLSNQEKLNTSFDKAETAADKAKAGYERLVASHKATTTQLAAAKAQWQEAESNVSALDKGVGGLGIKVYDAQGSFVGMQSVIAQLQPKLKGMTDQQRRVAEESLLGAGSFAKLDSTIMAGVPGWEAAAGAANKTGTAHTAAATATANLAGSMDRAKAGVSDLLVMLGQALTPVLASVVGWFDDNVIPALRNFIAMIQVNMPTIQAVIGTTFAVIGTILKIAVAVISGAITAIVAVIRFLIPIIQGIATVVGAVVAFAVANFRTIAPIIKGVFDVVAAIVGVAFNILSLPVKIFIAVVSAEFAIIKTIVSAVFGVVIGQVRTAISEISAIVNTIAGVFGAAFGAIAGVVGGPLRTVAGVVKTVFNGVISAINAVIGTIDGLSVHIHQGPLNIDWDGAKIPKIPTLDTGGIVTGPSIAMLAMNSVPEVVAPLPDLRQALGLDGSGGGAGNVTNVTIIVQGGDPQATVDALRKYMATNGAVPIKIAA